MALQSPGVEVKEIDLSTTIAAASTGRGATVGKAQWGPAYQISQVVNEDDLVRRFGKPNDYTAATFFTAANFLKYGNDLRFVRIVDEDTAKNSTPIFNLVVPTISAAGSGYVVGDILPIVDQYADPISSAVVTEVNENGGITLVRVASTGILEAIESGQTDIQLTGLVVSTGVNTGTGAIISLKLLQDSEFYLPNEDGLGAAFTNDYIDKSISLRVPLVAAKYPGEYGDKITVDIINYADYTEATGTIPSVPFGGSVNLKTLLANFAYGPENEDQYGILVSYDGVVAESFIVSTKPGDKDIYGSNIFVDDFFANGPSEFIVARSDSWIGPERGQSLRLGLSGGTDHGSGTDEYLSGWDMFADPETIYVNLLMAGSAAAENTEAASTIQKYILNEVAGVRKDCVAFVSPPRELVVNLSTANAIDKMVAWRTGKTTSGTEVADNLNVNTNFGFIDGNWKFQYDKYNDKNRWLPLNADIAGTCVFTDQVAQPWYSNGGLNRGQIKGVTKLAIAPTQAQRDTLYQAQINPVVNFAGEGFVLFGDKTSTTKNSAFSRINVRRLFNLLEKAISDAAKYKLFELNDEFTRTAFRTEISAFLDGVQAQRGIYDFYVECSERNNTAQVIDNNQFVASILIKPARSINYITLNFVATRTDANFEELLGAI